MIKIKKLLISVVKILNFEFLEEAIWNNASLTLTYILFSQSWMKPYFSKFQAKKKSLKPFILVPEMHQNAEKCT